MSDAADELRLERGRKFFARETVFMRGVVDIDGLPDADTTEIAFAGRSNVGKSSLVNALTGRKTLARTSNTPGRTKELNFFRLEGPEGRLTMVDLPGYGYARDSRERVEAWTELTLAYLLGRPNLRRILLLIDSRHGLKAIDLEVMAGLNEAAVSYQVVLTKADKLKPTERQKAQADVTVRLAKFPAAHPIVHLTSANTGDGIAELRAELTDLAAES